LAARSTSAPTRSATNWKKPSKLREEAQALLAEYQKKRKEAEKEAAEIVEAAKREAEAIT
jgi:F-type H+-transporting ATPase subunit b